MKYEYQDLVSSGKKKKKKNQNCRLILVDIGALSVNDYADNEG